MEAIFWITLLLDVPFKVELAGSQGLKSHNGKLFFSLSTAGINFKIPLCSRSVI